MFHNRRSGVEAEPLASWSETAPPIVALAPWSDPRRRLLDAMIKTVALRGYDRTTVSRVLSSAAVEEAVFSEHFRDKHDCFLQAIDDLICSAERSALEQFHRSAPWADRVRTALGILLCELARNPDSARVVLVEILSAGPAACERHRSALALFTSLIEEGRSEAFDSEHLPPQTSEAIIGGITSILQRRILQGNTAELPALQADLTYFALLPYLDHERALDFAGLHERRSPF
jgi:AcrR family transcriptional regulator